jgi:hypothetical protein
MGSGLLRGWFGSGLGLLVGPRSQASTAGHLVQDKELIRIAKVGIGQVRSQALTGRRGFFEVVNIPESRLQLHTPLAPR